MFIDGCAMNEPRHKHLLRESGLSMGALGPLAAQESILAKRNPSLRFEPRTRPSVWSACIPLVNQA
jgi:hypothetical protein